MTKKHLKRPDYAEVGQEDLYLLLVSAVRYALFRRTYIVSTTCSALARYAPILTSDQRGVIIRNITEAIYQAEWDGKKVGDDCDHQAWLGAVDSLVAMDNKAVR